MKRIFLKAAKESFYNGNGIGYLERTSTMAEQIFWTFDKDGCILIGREQFATAMLLIAECIDDMNINDFKD